LSQTKGYWFLFDVLHATISITITLQLEFSGKSKAQLDLKCRDFNSKLEILFWNHFFLLFTHFKIAKLITRLFSCFTLDIKHCNVSQTLWMRTKLLSLLLIMISKPWSLYWLKLCNFWTLLLTSMHHNLQILL
jgi:hypothetical protein